MYSTELIRKFPETPEQPILYVVYNEEMVKEAAFLIITIWGVEYLDDHVTIVPFKARDDYEYNRYAANCHQVWIDPLVFTYKNSWND